MNKPLTVGVFIEAFRIDTGWECAPDTRIFGDLTEFAQERDGSTRDLVELLILFKMEHGLPFGVRNTDQIDALQRPISYDR